MWVFKPQMVKVCELAFFLGGGGLIFMKMLEESY